MLLAVTCEMTILDSEARKGSSGMIVILHKGELLHVDGVVAVATGEVRGQS